MSYYSSKFSIMSRKVNSILIIGGLPKDRFNKAEELLKTEGLIVHEQNPDLLVLEPELSLGIGQIRQAQKFLSRRPYQAAKKAVLIPEAESLTNPAQNAFLKSLEEPPANSLIILCSQNQDQLLPTIVSRCQLIKLRAKIETEVDKKTVSHYQSLINQILNANLAKGFLIIEPYSKTREEGIKFCQEMIVVLRKKLISKKRTSDLDESSIISWLKSLRKTLWLLKNNINVRLALENLLIDLQKEK